MLLGLFFLRARRERGKRERGEGQIAQGAFARVAEASSARPSRPGQPEHGCNGVMSHVCPPGPI
jgi:hypothetical protein